MYNLPVLGHATGISRHLTAVHENIIAAGKLCRNAQRAKRLHKRSRSDITADYSVIHILEVMVHRSSAGNPAGKLYPVILQESDIDFRIGILIQSDNNGRSIAPQIEKRGI